jgi:NTE family protein
MDGDVTLDPHAARGYSRPAELQRRFEAAAEYLRLHDHWTTEDGQMPPGPPELRCDLALEGGGVKGIGLVGAVLVLDEAGYRIQRVAGTSAGAIAAALIAALVQVGRPMVELKTALDSLTFSNFMPEGILHRFFDRLGEPGEIAADMAVLTHRMGLYPGDYLEQWLTPILGQLRVTAFRDLKIEQATDPGMSLPPERRYRLVVHVSDVTRGELVRLPWDYDYYGVDRDAMAVVNAVRASMSIPFFFEPVTFQAEAAHVPTAVSGGETGVENYAPGTVTWVDGGMLRNFPISAFDRIDGKPPRWPTIGIKLSGFQDAFGSTTACTRSPEIAIRCLRTMMNEWDRYEIEESTAARTIFVPNGGITATQFELSKEEQDLLFNNGVKAATDFVIDMARYGAIPRTTAEAQKFAALRKQLTTSAGRH